jgi:2-polyprenyl-3-methyl-5-hydroxy-6-metoxy-1,4-benzoquinol methylase
VNTITMARRPTLGFLDRVASRKAAQQRALRAGDLPQGTRSRPPKTQLSILDVGFGDGDMLRAIHRWGQGRHIDLSLTGIDLNANSVAAARASTPDDMQISYVAGDYADLAGQRFDCIISSLVAHHMTHAQLVAFLSFMEAEAQCGWMINDLHRHGFAYNGYPLLATLMRWHPIVKADGRLSIARSYRPFEWPAILAEAGVERADVIRRFPFRLCVERMR